MIHRGMAPSRLHVRQVPLCADYRMNLADKCDSSCSFCSAREFDDGRFTPADCLEMLKAQNRDLGLVVDLTFSDRYYDG